MKHHHVLEFLIQIQTRRLTQKSAASLAGTLRDPQVAVHTQQRWSEGSWYDHSSTHKAHEAEACISVKQFTQWQLILISQQFQQELLMVYWELCLLPGV